MASSLPPGLDLSNFPLSPPPPGIASNFVDPTSLASLTLAVVVTLIVLTTLFVGIRLYTSIFIICSVGIEDCKVKTKTNRNFLLTGDYCRCLSYRYCSFDHLEVKIVSN